MPRIGLTLLSIFSIFIVVLTQPATAVQRTVLAEVFEGTW